MKDMGSTERLILLLSELARKPMTVMQASEYLSVDRSNAYRTLKKLEEHGFVFKFGKEYYGCMDTVIPQSYRETPYGVSEFSGNLLAKLAQKTHISAHLCMLTGSGATFIRQEFSENVINVVQRIGCEEPLYCTASGKILLAFLPEPMRLSLIDKISFVPYTDHTIVTREALLSELAETAERGYALDQSEYHPDVSCICCPIFDKKRMPRYAIGLSAPTPGGGMFDYEPYLSLLSASASIITRYLMGDTKINMEL